jgi:hypothetical protein
VPRASAKAEGTFDDLSWENIGNVIDGTRTLVYKFTCMKQVVLYMPDDLHRWLKFHSVEINRPMSQIAIELIEKYRQTEDNKKPKKQKR